MQAGKEPAPYRAHVKTRAWRMAHDLVLREREANVEARQAEAEGILAVEESNAAGDVDPEATARALAATGNNGSENAAKAPAATTVDIESDETEDFPIADKLVATEPARADALAVVRDAVTKAPKPAPRVFAAFGAAWRTMRRKAESAAQETVHDDVDEIRELDREIAHRIAVILCPKDRARIASARGGPGKRTEAVARRIARESCWPPRQTARP
jgi:hypothetical protein